MTPLAKSLIALFNIKELDKEWEESFYESDWDVDTLELTTIEKEIIEELTTFLPRHMMPYDWNLPFSEEIILIIRRHIAKAITTNATVRLKEE